MTRTVLLVTTLLVGCATGAVVREVVAPARAQGQAGTNYEYDEVSRTRNANTEKPLMNQYGRQGWRLVTATEGALYFERQLPAH
jgi:hypothetical protein